MSLLSHGDGGVQELWGRLAPESSEAVTQAVRSCVSWHSCYCQNLLWKLLRRRKHFQLYSSLASVPLSQIWPHFCLWPPLCASCPWLGMSQGAVSSIFALSCSLPLRKLRRSSHVKIVAISPPEIARILYPNLVSNTRTVQIWTEYTVQEAGCMSEGAQILPGTVLTLTPQLSGHDLNQDGNLLEKELLEKWGSSKSLDFTDEPSHIVPPAQAGLLLAFLR